MAAPPIRRVTGRAVTPLTPAEFAKLADSYEDVVLDVGTGDGKHVLAVARARPRALVVGLDAAVDALRAPSTRAAAKPARGGLPNALFVQAAAEALPAGLDGLTEVHALMPWGSLLRGLAAGNPPLLQGIAARCRPGARFLITFNLHAWNPPVPEVGETLEPTPESALTDLAGRYAEAGWHIDAAHYPSAAEMDELGTSWTKRLRSSRAALDVLAVRGSITASTAG